MKLSQEQLERFRALYKRRFGIDIKGSELEQKASRVLRQMELLYQPIQKSDLERIGKEYGGSKTDYNTDIKGSF